MTNLFPLSTSVTTFTNRSRSPIFELDPEFYHMWITGIIMEVIQILGVEIS